MKRNNTEHVVEYVRSAVYSIYGERENAVFDRVMTHGVVQACHTSEGYIDTGEQW